MQRYFNNNIINNTFILSDDDSYHIEKVMRMKIKDLIEVVCNNQLYICQIISFNPVKCQVIEKKNDNNELNKKIIVVQSLVNEQKMDLLLQKCTELGVYAIYPLITTNSIIKVNKDFHKKIVRWQKIVKEAAEQSKRNMIPIVNDIIDINELIKLEFALKMVCSVNNQSNSLKKILQDNNSCDTIVIVVGPEGGLTDIEESLLIDNHFIPVTLGKRVLRTETASLVALSMINYEWMVK